MKKKGKHTPNFVPIVMEPGILEACDSDTLCIDNFYVNGNVFFHTITRRMKFRTVAAIINRRKATLMHETKAVLNLYAVKGYEITSVHADQEFKCIKEDIRPI